MNIELAKQLKDAEFPQRKEWEVGYFYCEDCKELHLFKDDPDEGNFVGEDYGHRWKDFDESNWLTCSTLSELIEQTQKKCKFITLQNETGHDWMVWHDLEEDGKLKCYGSTPEEAVARLWLALNSKE